MSKMQIQKTWLTVHFSEGEASIEATLNYLTNSFCLTHSNNDENVTFKSKDGSSIKACFDRVKCVTAALKFIQSELKL